MGRKTFSFVLGLGEIGKAVYQLLSSYQSAPYFSDEGVVAYKDLNEEDIPAGTYTYFHICIPYSSNFINIVKDEVLKYGPQSMTRDTPILVVVNSTVPIGTCRKLENAFARSDIRVAHMPVRGKHPNLVGGIKSFDSILGAKDFITGLKIKNYLEERGSFDFRPDRVLNNYEESEAAKLLDTTYYGVCIAFHDYANQVCKENNLDFDNVVTSYNESYNTGYKKLGYEKYTRPILSPPNGPIGGHCVVPNAKLLKAVKDSLLLKAIIDVGKKSE